VETLIGILVGGTIGVFVLRMALDDWFKRARIRRALTRRELQPALSDDVAPRELTQLGLTEPFRIGDTVGGRATLAGVEADGILEQIIGEDYTFRTYLLTLRVAGLQIITEGMRRDADDIETGDPTLDGLFILKGTRDEVATRLDADARKALVAAADAGWRGRGDALVRSGVRELDLRTTLATGLEAARRLLAQDPIARLERTATADPAPRMRRLALGTLLLRHSKEPATRRALDAAMKGQDPLARWLACRPTPADEPWLRMTSNLLLDATKAPEIAEMLLWLDVTEALPALGASEPHLTGAARTAIERARRELAARASARGRGAAGALALSNKDAGQLALDE